MESEPFTIETFVSMPYAELSYLAWRDGATQALVVDPGFEPERILERVAHRGLRVSTILLTHGHVDHIAGVRAIRAGEPDASIIIGRDDAALLSDPALNLSLKFGTPITSPPADRLVQDGERLDVAGFSFLVREIPGHSPGSVVYIADEFDPAFVFAGDVLFAGSVGRTDLGGDAPLLFRGIRRKLMILPDGTRILPGHGPATTVGVERASNPFVGERARPDSD